MKFNQFNFFLIFIFKALSITAISYWLLISYNVFGQNQNINNDKTDKKCKQQDLGDFIRGDNQRESAP